MNKKLIEKAIEMRDRSHAPYSDYTVGAAVLSRSGDIIGGCNVESSSYGLTCCAERVALFSAKSNYPNESVKKLAITATSNKFDFRLRAIPKLGEL